ncbi:MAG: hypothetical protein AAF705_18505, partial [Bacteroidota bacterium]
IVAGEKITAEKEVMHRFYSESDEPVIFRGYVTPGYEGFEYFLPIFYGLSADGLVDEKGNIKNLRYTAVLLTMSGTKFPGILSLLSWVFRQIAKTKKSQQVKAGLIQKYCFNNT